MLTIPHALQVQGDAAAAKVTAARHPSRYLVSAMLAGAYVGIGVLLMTAAAGPFLAAQSPATALVQGAVFGIALMLVIFAGGELATSAMMILAQGVILGRVRALQATGVLLFAFFGNLAGAVVLAALVHGAGTMNPDAPTGQMLAYLIEHKGAETNAQLFFRGVLCNILVCLAIWAVGRMTSEAAKIIVVAWCLFAFVSLGFEHVIANMTTFSLGLMGGVDGATLGAMARNLLIVGLGNAVGGAVFVGAAYAWVGRPATPSTEGGAPDDAAPGDEDAAGRESAAERAELGLAGATQAAAHAQPGTAR